MKNKGKDKAICDFWDAVDNLNNCGITLCDKNGNPLAIEDFIFDGYTFEYEKE